MLAAGGNDARELAARNRRGAPAPRLAQQADLGGDVMDWIDHGVDYAPSRHDASSSRACLRVVAVIST
ncbi:hypothetical protein C1X36_33985, partial [Pseudomonas sp. GW460-8]